MSRAPTYLGPVQDVQGATVSIALDEATLSGLTFIDGRGYRIGQTGGFVRIAIGFLDLFGIVSEVGAGAVPESLQAAEPHGTRWMRVQLIGESLRAGAFQRGISQYPTIGDEAHLVVEADLRRIYGRGEAGNHVRIGTVASAESIPALINLDKLVSRHSAVVGTTGAGKSTTVAGLLTHLSDPTRFPSSRIVLLDMHGEYQRALGDRATVFRVNADADKGERELFIPYWALNLDEFLRVTPYDGVNDADRGGLVTQIRRLKEGALKKQARDGVTLDTVTVDTPVPFSVHRFWYELHRLVSSTHTAQAQNQNSGTEAIARDANDQPILGDIMKVVPPRYQPITGGGQNRVFLSSSPLNIRRQTDALESLLRDSRYDFLFRPGPWCPKPTLDEPDAQPESDLDDLLEGWIGGDKPITILDLSGVPASVLEDLIGALLRLLFDAAFWSRYLPEGARTRPLLVVLEEAHTYLAPGSKGAAATAVRRIVKEGRKYGFGAMIVSQRPSEIDSTVFSQCGTLIAMRLANSSDRAQVSASASDSLEGLFRMLPSLRTGEAIVVGEAVPLPIRTLVDAPAANRRPESADPRVFDESAARGWNALRRKEDYARVVKGWRAERATTIPNHGEE